MSIAGVWEVITSGSAQTMSCLAQNWESSSLQTVGGLPFEVEVEWDSGGRAAALIGQEHK
eukprot:3555427-Amphidinium_carterae.4